jgi:hypothetical protein
MQIEVDFEVFKALTARRRHEGHTYNDVVRELCGLPARDSKEIEIIPAARPPGQKRSFVSRDLSLPHGTQLRATYKGTSYCARIDDGRWIDEDGVEHRSPSAAARYITGNNVNGLRFWQGKRPDDQGWLNLDVLMILG